MNASSRGGWNPLPFGVEVRPSLIAGQGLFTSVARRSGERILEIEGEIIDGDEAEARDSLGNVYIYEVDDLAYIDASSTAGRHVNHSCTPTCGIQGDGEESRLWLVARQDLAPGAELTIDYDYPEIFEACRRHAPNCAGDSCPRAREALAGGGEPAA